MPRTPTDTVAASGRGANTRERILLVAARMFRYGGFESTSLRDIAREVGITAGSIYNHFSSKEQILDAVLRLGITNVADEVRARVAALPPTATWRERIETAIRYHLLSALHQGDFTSANIRLWALLPAEIKDRQRAVRRDYSDYWRSLFEGAQAAGELRPDLNVKIVENFIVGALNWTGEWYDPRRGSFEALCHELTTMIFDGLEASETHAPNGA
jgi:TetR/AcrR family transcriptional regulator, cholesterol catabolism regulator